jgi:hypothetical protein
MNRGTQEPHHRSPTVGVGAGAGAVKAAIISVVIVDGASMPLSRSPSKIWILKM